MVFTIPFEYREYFRKERDALNILFIDNMKWRMKGELQDKEKVIFPSL